MIKEILTMSLLKEKYGVCRLDKDEAIPGWAINSDFYSVAKTMDELSIVCSQDSIPNEVNCEKDWRVLKVEGPLDFSLIGILSSISTILAQESISIFAISTYDTDYILIKSDNIDKAIDVLSKENYKVIR